MSRSATNGQKRQLLHYCQQAICASSGLDYEAVKRLTDDGPAIASLKERMEQLIGEYCPNPEPEPRVLWKQVITLGTHPDFVSLIREVDRRGWLVEKGIRGIPYNVRLTKPSKKIRVIVTTVEALGFEGWTPIETVQLARLKYGWRLCPDEAAFQFTYQGAMELCRKYWFLTEPLPVDDTSSAYGFSITNLSNPGRVAGSLYTVYGSSEFKLIPSDTIVFTEPV